MCMKMTLRVAAVTVTLGLMSSASAHAVPSHIASATEQARPVVSLTASKAEVVEGDRLTLSAKVPSAATATSVTLERYGYDSLYRLGWQKVSSRKAAKKTSFKVTVTDKNKVTYRVVVKYRGVTKPVTSKPSAVKVWRWIPLDDVSRYYTTGGTGFGTASLSGRTYNAWGMYTYAKNTSHEDRFTPGRNCKSFKGLAGITDLSSDGSSGAVVVYADDAPVWQSPSLTPGTTVPFEVALSLPYRMSLIATNTSAEGIKAYPAIGDPALLCTGI